MAAQIVKAITNETSIVAPVSSSPAGTGGEHILRFCRSFLGWLRAPAR